MSKTIVSGMEFSEHAFDGMEQKGSTVEGAVFEGCSFIRCNFSGSAFKRCHFIDCSFEHCDLSNLQLIGASLRDVNFKDCKAVGINWTSATSISHLGFERCILNYAVFTGLDLRNYFFKSSVAREADFAEANLSDVNCRGTDFAGARFSTTNLSKADFRGATNYSIRPDSNKLKKAKFSLPEATLLLYGLDIELEE